MNNEKILAELKIILGVGQKVIERIFNKLVLDKKLVDSFQTILNQIKNEYDQCPTCFCLINNNGCFFCNNDKRDQTKLCIVTNLFDIAKFENTRVFNGVYHVLNAEINVKNGIIPEKITFNMLEHRMNDKIIKEVIIAVSSTFEGEVTAQYLKILLTKFNVKITRLARGIPIGGSLDYIDEITLKQALEGRENI